MDISIIKQKLSALQNPRGGQKKDLSLTIWRPAVGKHSVRVVPSAYNKQNPFKEVFIHYGINNRTMISPTNFGEKDPIVEFAQSLRKSKEKEDWSSAKKLEPKMRIFAPVIVRGEEDKGVRLWEFGKQVYMELLAFAEDEDIGDFTDPIVGRDITVETLDKETTGLMYNTSKVKVRTKTTPLSEDAAKVKIWLENQPDPLTQFKKYTYEDMKEALLKHLNPEEELKEQADSVEAKPDNKSSAFTLNTSKEAIDTSIDDLFKLD
jgi:hypothetical protein